MTGAASLGDPACIPFILDLMAEESLSRLSAWAYASVTGLQLAPPFANREVTRDPTPEQVVRRAHDPMEDLPTPDAEQLVAHWSDAKGSFEVGKRYRAGVVLSNAHLQEILRSGKQPWRYDSALALAHAGEPLLSVTAPGPLQQQRLAAPRSEDDQ